MNMGYLCLYLCILLFISPISYNFQSTGLWPSWLSLFLDIIFDAIVSGIIFLLPLSYSLLLVYRNANDIYILFLYPATLLNSFINFNRFLVEFLEFSICKILSSANRQFYFILSYLDVFYFLSLLNCFGWDLQ